MDENSLLLQITHYFVTLSGWEVIATILGIVYVILAAKESIWCWPSAFISSLIYAVVFWEGQLLMQAILYVFYTGMAIYGFLLWKHHDANDEVLHVNSWGWLNHLIFITVATILSLGIGYYLSNYTDTRLPYLDASVMIFSIINTFLMARKVLENWLYWLIIDVFAIYLYWKTGFYPIIILFIVYLVLAVYGFKEWRKSFQKTDLSKTENTGKPYL